MVACGWCKAQRNLVEPLSPAAQPCLTSCFFGGRLLSSPPPRNPITAASQGMLTCSVPCCCLLFVQHTGGLRTSPTPPHLCSSMAGSMRGCVCVACAASPLLADGELPLTPNQSRRIVQQQKPGVVSHCLRRPVLVCAEWRTHFCAVLLGRPPCAAPT